MSVRVDLWTWRCGLQDAARLLSHLSPDEIARADRYHFAHDRVQFIGARGRLRELLGARAGIAPADLVFALGEHGKPSLVQAPELSFNFSDTGDYGCLAVAPDGAGALGVDIETIRPRDYLKLSQRYFSPAEHRLLAAAPEDMRAAAFFRGWTRKEAFLKAVGTGLATRLDAFEVTIGADEPARLTRIDPAIDADLGAWALAAFDAAPEVAGAVALRTGGAAIDLVVREAPAV